ncbi:phage baseplate plug family protein [Sodalis sp. (in: enterobacteria)]|uniref:phage baseplate plug family protein n=1 Tax=Sodalis sp. (in: enterobacteria) TaxID=1898979 RepID=UPI003F2C84C7
MVINEIPLTATNQQFSITLSGTLWQMRIIWRDVAGWVLDMLNASGDPVITGIPLIPGTDLLAQYGWLNPGGRLVAVTDDDQLPDKTATGRTAKLYWLIGN